ncbi:hypothetical protein MHUMG1_09807 [Metarhizium humberi]|uniref:Uncharacterized protein n=1 Tax=Metarhizium humberi TaxID=2596975 RepID=A0A9P8M1D5_9HYPO|nr:hypothetical protein MHUMG1_09807 [Metarhizium humberi]
MEHSRTKSTSASPETSISILPRTVSTLLPEDLCLSHHLAAATRAQPRSPRKSTNSSTNPVPEAPGTNERSLHNPITTFLRTKEPLSATGGVYISPRRNRVPRLARGAQAARDATARARDI